MIKLEQTCLTVKLGSNCNLNCTYCHSKKQDIELNPDIFDFIKSNVFKFIYFSGGEPFLYFDLMKKIIDYNDKNIRYRSPTNGTVITDEMMEYINSKDFYLFLSYDGLVTGRDTSVPIRTDVLNRYNGNLNISAVVQHDFNYEHAVRDIITFQQKQLGRDVQFIKNFIHFNFLHQTNVVSASQIFTTNDVDRYIDYTCKQLDSDLFEYTRGNFNIHTLKTLYHYSCIYKNKELKYGVKCCNNNKIGMNVKGEFQICPYGDTKIGDIYSGVDVDKLNSLIPIKCLKCNIFRYCRNQCIANTSDNEWRMIKSTFKHFLKLCDKYKVNPDNLTAQVKDV